MGTRDVVVSRQTFILDTLLAKNMEYFFYFSDIVYMWIVQGVSVLEIHSYEQIF